MHLRVPFLKYLIIFNSYTSNTRTKKTRFSLHFVRFPSSLTSRGSVFKIPAKNSVAYMVTYITNNMTGGLVNIISCSSTL